jgi:hypothetical protein
MTPLLRRSVRRRMALSRSNIYQSRPVTPRKISSKSNGNPLVTKPYQHVEIATAEKPRRLAVPITRKSPGSKMSDRHLVLALAHIRVSDAKIVAVIVEGVVTTDLHQLCP